MGHLKRSSHLFTRSVSDDVAVEGGGAVANLPERINVRIQKSTTRLPRNTKPEENQKMFCGQNYHKKGGEEGRGGRLFTSIAQGIKTTKGRGREV